MRMEDLPSTRGRYLADLYGTFNAWALVTQLVRHEPHRVQSVDGWPSLHSHHSTIPSPSAASATPRQRDALARRLPRTCLVPAPLLGHHHAACVASLPSALNPNESKKRSAPARIFIASFLCHQCRATKLPIYCAGFGRSAAVTWKKLSDFTGHLLRTPSCR